MAAGFCSEDGFAVGASTRVARTSDAGGGHAGEDLGGLLGGFVLGVDDFGEAGAEGAVVIDAGVAEVFVGEVGEALGGGGWE